MECSYSKEVWHGLAATHPTASDIATRPTTILAGGRRSRDSERIKLKENKLQLQSIERGAYGRSENGGFF
jgi:hypothetical protein